MSESEKKQIREIQSVLQKINNGVNVFFNITTYKRLGLITVRKKWGENAHGNKVERGHTFHLTPKAKKYLNVII